MQQSDSPIDFTQSGRRMKEPGAGVEDADGIDADLRQRRREKIMASREERIAKIMSTASGRKVDPKEVVLEKFSPPPATTSDAGSWPLADAPLEAKGSPLPAGKHSGVASPAAGRRAVRVAKFGEALHILFIITTAIAYFSWTRNPSVFKFIPAGLTPWHVMLSSFVAIEMLQVIGRRVGPTLVIADFCLYLLVIICMQKLWL